MICRSLIYKRSSLTERTNKRNADTYGAAAGKEKIALHLGVKRLQKLQITQMNNGLYGVI